jgi:hypothetical protein
MEHSQTGNLHDDWASRVTQVKDGAVVLAEYRYNGSGSVVSTDLPEPDMFSNRHSSTPGDYPDLDRFNRPIADDWMIDRGHSASTVANRRAYAGYEIDPVAAWEQYHVRHRVLNSDLGRWISRDPLPQLSPPPSQQIVPAPTGYCGNIVPAIVELQSIVPAQYMYAVDDPIGRVDPSGLLDLAVCVVNCPGGTPFVDAIFMSVVGSNCPTGKGKWCCQEAREVYCACKAAQGIIDDCYLIGEGTFVVCLICIC